MTIGLTFHLSPYQTRRAERLGLKTPPPGFYRIEQSGRYRNLDTHRLYAKTTVENARFGRPAGRKGWDSLSASYRRRLEKSGITRRSYNSGEKLHKARGHVNETLPGRRLPPRYRQFTTRGDTDYFNVPADDNGRAQLLAYLLARGYQAIRAIYEKDGQRDSSHWIALTQFNLGRIRERYVNDPFMYTGKGLEFGPEDLTLFAVIPTKSKSKPSKK